MKARKHYIRPTSAVINMLPITLLAGSLMRSGEINNSSVYDENIDPSQAL